MSKPETTFSLSGVRAAVFRNEGKDGPFRSITLERRYQDGQEWKSSNSFTKSQAAAALVVLQQAVAFVLEQDREDE